MFENYQEQLEKENEIWNKITTNKKSVPPGFYVAAITDSRIQPSKSKNVPLLVTHWRIDGPNEVGFTFQKYHTIFGEDTESGKKAQGITKGMLKRLGIDSDLKQLESNLPLLLGKRAEFEAVNNGDYSNFNMLKVLESNPFESTPNYDLESNSSTPNFNEF